jgi:hypothetical protein
MRDRIGCGMRPEKLAPFDGETNFGRSLLHKRRKKATINREIIARNVVRVPFFRRTFWHIHPNGFCSILDFGKRCVPTHFDKFIFNFSRKKFRGIGSVRFLARRLGQKKIPEGTSIRANRVHFVEQKIMQDQESRVRLLSDHVQDFV